MTAPIEIPENEIAERCAEALYGDDVRVINNWNIVTVPVDRVFGTHMEFNPLIDPALAYAIIFNPEYHSKIIDKLQKWFEETYANQYLDDAISPWQHNKIYLQSLLLWMLREFIVAMENRNE